MIDTYRHKGLRKKLAETLRSKGITDLNVIKAIESVPRHFFMDSSFLEFAYEDKAFPIGSGQTISQPFTVAFQTQLLEVRKEDKVLEVGTGSGYQASILVHMGAKVFTIERQKNLYNKTHNFFEKRELFTILSGKPRLFYGDGYKGKPTFAPFDRIIVTAAAPYIPEALTEQLKPGGRMVIPVGPGETQEMIRIIKSGTGELIKENYGTFRFVPLLNNKALD